MVTIGQALNKLEDLKYELSGIKQAMQFFKSPRYSRLRKALEVEKLKIEEEIDELEEKLYSLQVEIKL